MKNSEFERMVFHFRERQDKLILTKGHDYTVGNGDEDRLWNFKTVASMLGISPLQALGVYWLKHVFAICTYIKMGKVESEDIDGRFLDESNYNLLGRALINDLLGSPFEEIVCPEGEKVPAVRKQRSGRDKKPASKRKVLQGSRRKLR